MGRWERRKETFLSHKPNASQTAQVDNNTLDPNKDFKVLLHIVVESGFFQIFASEQWQFSRYPARSNGSPNSRGTNIIIATILFIFQNFSL